MWMELPTPSDAGAACDASTVVLLPDADAAGNTINPPTLDHALEPACRSARHSTLEHDSALRAAGAGAPRGRCGAGLQRCPAAAEQRTGARCRAPTRLRAARGWSGSASWSLRCRIAAMPRPDEEIPASPAVQDCSDAPLRLSTVRARHAAPQHDSALRAAGAGAPAPDPTPYQGLLEAPAFPLSFWASGCPDSPFSPCGLKGGGFAGRLSTVSVPPNARADPSVS